MSTNVEPSAFIEAIINSMAEPVTVINSAYEIMWMNRAARNFLFGDSPPLKPFLCYECHHKRESPCDDLTYNCPLNRMRLSHEPLTSVHEHFNTDGQKRCLEIVCSPLLSQDGSFQGIIEVARDITGQKQMTEEFNVLASIMQTVPDAVCSFDRDGTIRIWNEGAERMLGYKREELIGMSVTTVIPGSEIEYSLAALDKKGVFTGYLSVRTAKDGRVVPVEVSGVAIKDKDQNITSYASITRDITERNKTGEALRHSEEYFRAVTENASDIITILGADGAIRYESFSIERILGYGREELLGRDVFEFIHPDDKSGSMKTFAEVMEKPSIPLSLKVRFLHKNMTWRTLEVVGVNLLHNPAVGGIVINSRDITKREEAEQQLKKTTDELARSNADLQQFAYVASHDLQEPLRIIESFVKLLARRYKDKLDDKAEEFIGFTIDGVRRMQDLIKDLLEYSRVGTKGINLKPVDFSLAADRAVLNLQSAIEESNAVITHDKLPSVMADASQLNSLFQNLFSNAIKFHGMEAPRIHVSAERKEDDWIFSVKDNGIGIKPSESERIFAVFQRLHGRGEYPGTGIGLAICKRIVERHGGRIWVESEPEKGSVFFFTIPDRKVEAYTHQRRHERVKKEIRFDFFHQADLFKAHTIDVSEGGLSIRVFGRPPVRDDSVIDLSVEDSRIKARVVWTERLPDQSVFGLQKLDYPPENRDLQL
jgi:PAS domain S-box-containing protein